MTLHTDSLWISIMVAGPLLLLLFFLLLFFFLIWWRPRRFRAQLFSKQFDVDTTVAFQESVLREINQECTHYPFVAERLAHVPFRGQEISIVYGSVAWSMDETSIKQCFYAVADAQQSQWMRQHSDVFEAAFIGTAFSVFWVKIPALLRLTRRSSRIDAPREGSWRYR